MLLNNPQGTSDSSAGINKDDCLQNMTDPRVLLNELSERVKRLLSVCAAALWLLLDLCFGSLFYLFLTPPPSSSSEITRHHRNDIALKTNPVDLPVRENSLSIHKRCCNLRSGDLVKAGAALKAPFRHAVALATRNANVNMMPSRHVAGIWLYVFVQGEGGTSVSVMDRSSATMRPFVLFSCHHHNLLVSSCCNVYRSEEDQCEGSAQWRFFILQKLD